jgi:membrane protease YdiL (CAAX protease family)
MQPDPVHTSKWGLILRVGVFAFLEIAGLNVFATLLMPVGGYLVAAALGTFAAAAVANAVAVRIWERGRLSDIGLGWNQASRHNLGVGAAAGVCAALLVVGLPLLTGAARIEWEAAPSFHWPTFFFVSLVLLFGAVGEEMLFRGYGFQVLVNALGPYATILPVSIVFGFAHAANSHATGLGIFNTVAWGVIFGVAFLRSGDLWLPIGLHFGWNWTLPVFGANLSGFKMVAGGYAMRWSAGPLWSGGEYGPEAGLLTSLVVIPLMVFLFRGPVRRQRAWLLRDLQGGES